MLFLIKNHDKDEMEKIIVLIDNFNKDVKNNLETLGLTKLKETFESVFNEQKMNKCLESIKMNSTEDLQCLQLKKNIYEEVQNDGNGIIYGK